jgi:hypothetical protein
MPSVNVERRSIGTGDQPEKTDRVSFCLSRFDKWAPSIVSDGDKKREQKKGAFEIMTGRPPCYRDVIPAEAHQHRSASAQYFVSLKTDERSSLGCLTTLHQVTVKLSMCLVKHHAMKTSGGAEVYLHEFLTSAVDIGEWAASRSGRFTRKDIIPETLRLERWVGPRTDL